MSKKSDITIKSRLNLKIDGSLKDWAMEYAAKKKTTVTSMICAYLQELQEEDLRRQSGELVEQI